MKFIRLKTAYSSSAGKRVKVSHLLPDLSDEEVGTPSYYQEFAHVSRGQAPAFFHAVVRTEFTNSVINYPIYREKK